MVRWDMIIGPDMLLLELKAIPFMCIAARAPAAHRCLNITQPRRGHTDPRRDWVHGVLLAPVSGVC